MNTFFIEFISSMLKENSLLDDINLFCSNEYGKNDKTILKYFHKLKKIFHE